MKPIKIKKVLIALDYDPTAQKVAEMGYSMAQSMEAEVTLLHVIVDGTYYSALQYSTVGNPMGFSAIDVTNLLDEKGLKSATHLFLEKTKQHLGDDKNKTLIKEGDFAESIMKAAKDMHADIIVMGSHSRRWLDEILMGSVTEKVLKMTKIPLFIVPTKKHN